MTDPTLIEQVVSLIRARAKQHPSKGLMGRQALDESHVKYGQALLSALADEIERTSLCGEDLGPCELCDRPLALGQFVNQYDDIGTAHANCEVPFAKPLEETPAPGDDGSTMLTYVLLGVPALLESISEPTLQGSAALPSEDAEDDAWAWLDHYSRQRHGEAPQDVAFSADQMVDAFIAGTERATTPTAPDQDTGASVPDQALAVPVEPVARLAPSGFDPSRRETLTYEVHRLAHKAHLLSRQIATMTYNGMVAHRPRVKMLRAVERDATTIHGLAEAMIAIATEARRAETVEQGSVHEGAGPEDIAHD